MPKYSELAKQTQQFLEDSKNREDIAANEHFKKLLDLYNNLDFDGLVNHLQQGLVQFPLSTSFWKSVLGQPEQSYGKFLQDFKELFIVLDESEKNARLESIFKAIRSGSSKAIHTAVFESGGIAVLETRYSGTNFDNNSSVLDIADSAHTEARSKNKDTIIFYLACMYGWENEVSMLLKKGFKPTQLTASGQTFLSLAYENHHKDIVKILLQNNADPNLLKEFSSETLLHLAAQNSDIRLLENILQASRKVNVNQKNKEGKTALEIAVEKNAYFMVEKLLKAGANPNIRSDRESLLYKAVIKNSASIVEALVNSGCDIDEDAYYTAKSKIDNQGKKIWWIGDNIFPILRKPLSEEKHAIMDKRKDQEKLIAQYAKNLDPMFQAVISQTYFEKDEYIKPFIDQLIKLNSEDKKELVKPIIQTLSLACLGLRSEKSKYPNTPFKMVLASEETLNKLVASGENIHGIYKWKNTIYVSGKKMLPTFIHESKHFVDLEVFNTTKLGHIDDEESKILFLKIVEKLAGEISNLEKTIPTTEKIQHEALAILKRIYNYEPKKRDCELLARVPQVLTLLGVDTGYAWLKKNFPDLIEAYETTCLSAIKKYNEERSEFLVQDLTSTITEIESEFLMQDLTTTISEIENVANSLEKMLESPKPEQTETPENPKDEITSPKKG